MMQSSNSGEKFSLWYSGLWYRAGVGGRTEGNGL